VGDIDFAVPGNAVATGAFVPDRDITLMALPIVKVEA
jgi:hypothetical protein